MNNPYDEIKKLLESSRNMTGQSQQLDQIKESLIKKIFFLNNRWEDLVIWEILIIWVVQDPM